MMAACRGDGIFTIPVFRQLRQDVEWMRLGLGLSDPVQCRKRTVYIDANVVRMLDLAKQFASGEKGALHGDLSERVNAIRAYLPLDDWVNEESVWRFVDGVLAAANVNVYNRQNVSDLLIHVQAMCDYMRENEMNQFMGELAYVAWTTARSHRVDVAVAVPAGGAGAAAAAVSPFVVRPVTARAAADDGMVNSRPRGTRGSRGRKAREFYEV